MPGLQRISWSLFLATLALILGAWGPTPIDRPSFLPPEVPLTVEELAIVEASKGVEPDLFGEPLQRLALLKDYDARLAAMYSAGDLELVGTIAFAWAMRPDDVRRRPEVFVAVVDEAEAMLDQAAITISRGEQLSKSQYRTLVMYMLICNHLALLNDPDLAALTPRLDLLGCGLIDRTGQHQHLYGGAIYLLYEIEQRGEISERGAALLQDRRDEKIDFDEQMGNWHAENMEDFMGVAPSE